MSLKLKHKRNNLRLNIFLVIFIAVFSLTISLLKFSKGYIFEWDQADDAAKVVSIINQKKPLLIGPRVSNDDGFFVGPYHYYFLLPFYLITKGDPIAGCYAVAFINLITSLCSFLLIKKMFGSKIAFLSSIFMVLSLGKISWSVMYAPLISIIAFYICYQSINKKFYFPLAMLFTGIISNIHLVPISLIPIIIISFFLSKNKPNLKEIILGMVLFIIPFIPLIIFDLRHDFLNLTKLLSFIFVKDGGSNQLFVESLWLRSFWRSLGFFNFFPLILNRLLSLILLIISPFLFKNPKHKILIIIWFILPLIILSRYHGAISEYYYDMINFLLPLFFSLFLFQFIKNELLITIIVLLFSILSIYKISVSRPELITLNDKKMIVEYLVSQKQDQPFNLSYETGPSFEFGFDYLFKFYKNQPQNTNNAHLYTLFIDNTLPPHLPVVFKSHIYSLVRR